MPPETAKGRARTQVPSPADYKRALESLAPLAPSYLAMLQFHYRQPERTARGLEVGEAAGFQNNPGGTANLHYGRLAKLVGTFLGWRPKGKVNLYVLATFKRPDGHWRWIMRREIAQALEGLGWVGPSVELLPGEMPERTRFREGAVYRVAVTAYERNPEARRACLAHYGASCVVCGFNFKTTYELEEDFIHVHHVRMLAEIGEEYTIDPVKDLRPVCANCHSVIHLKTPPYGIEELKAMIGARRKAK
jgi:5-methylcytosine-specific restriction enzyme A